MAKALTRSLGIVLLLLLASTVGAMGGRKPATLSGTVRVVGNEPFTRVVITASRSDEPVDGTRDWLITGPLREELRKRHQGKQVTLIGEPCTPPSPEFSRCFRPVKIATSAPPAP